MNLNGVNRVIVAVRNLEESKRSYFEAFGATFEDANWTGEAFGIDVAISWDAGIELCAPKAGREINSVVSEFLAQKGEGIMNVVLGVHDARMSVKLADAAGVTAVHSLDYSQEEIDDHLGGLFQKYEEHVLDSKERFGFSITLGQIEPK